MGIRKLVAVLLSFSMILPASMVSASEGGYTDVANHWAKDSIQKWSDKGIVSGANQQFRPNDSITRGELAVMLDRVMNYQEKATNSFVDLGTAFYSDAMLKANEAGVLKGDGGKLRPKDKVTREEAAVIMGRAFGVTEQAAAKVQFSDQDHIAAWSQGYINALAAKSYISGKGNGVFDPKGNLTRSETVKLLDNMVKQVYNVQGTYSDGTLEGNVVINTPNVILENTVIKGDLILAEGIGEGDVTLNNVKVEGNTFVKGGGENSIHFNSVTVGGALVVNKVNGSVRIVATGSTQVSVTVLDSGAILVERELTGGGFEKVEISAAVEAGQKVVLNGNFTSVTNSAKSVAIDAKGTIDKLVLNESTTVTGTATIKDVTTAKGADSTVNGKDVAGGASGTVISNNPTTTTTPSTGSSGSSSSGGSSSGSGSEGDGGSSVTEATYTVSFDTNGGSAVQNIVIKSGMKIAKPADPVRDGMAFSGWYQDANLSSPWNFDTDVVTSNITLFAKWSVLEAGWQNPDYVDPLFAAGYPQALIEDGHLILKIKLADSVTESNPAEVFMVVNQINSRIDADVEAVIHGHTGINDYAQVDEWPYAVVKDNSEITITSKHDYLNNRDINVYFVVKTKDTVSSQVTKLSFQGEVMSELDMSAPYFGPVFANKERTKLFLHFNEKLDVNSVPAISAFQISGMNEAGVSKVEVVNKDVQGYSPDPSMVVLSVYGLPETTSLNNINLVYTLPDSGAIQDMSANENKLPSFMKPIVSAAPQLSWEDVKVSQDKQYITFTMKPSFDVSTLANIRDVLTLKYGSDEQNAQPIDLTDARITYSYSQSAMDVGIVVPESEMDKVSEQAYYYIGLNNADNTILDYAQDPVALLEVIAKPNTSPVTVTSATYQDGVLNVFTDGTPLSSSIAACSFTLDIDGHSVVLRGNAFYFFRDGKGGLQFTADSIPATLSEEATMKLSYKPAHSLNAMWYDLLKDASGRPLAEFSDLPVTLGTGSIQQ